MQLLTITTHARQRLQQRGVRASALTLLVKYADIEIAAGRDCHFFRLSHSARRHLLEKGFQPQEIDRAARLVVLMSEQGAIVTVIKRDPGIRFRQWRRVRA